MARYLLETTEKHYHMLETENELPLEFIDKIKDNIICMNGKATISAICNVIDENYKQRYSIHPEEYEHITTNIELEAMQV